ncbi:MAG: 30S ribosomal protein S9 [Candidatus Micrarchaeia archaeon]
MAKKIKKIEKGAAPKEKKKKEKIVIVRGKRKESIARAVVREGKGIVRINRMSLDAYTQPYVRDIMREPLLLAGDVARGLDIDVNVHGGGVMGQAEAVRLALARGICEFTGDAALRARFAQYDPYLLKEDPRRVEPKKYKGPKARARFQKSYR